MAAACRSLVGEDDVAYYPAWETLPHERLSPRSDTVGRRLAVLRRVVGNDELPSPKIIVAPVRSVLQPQVKGLGHMAPVRLVVGADTDLDDLAQALVGAAYIRVDMVERRGEFAVRGGIVDIFPPTEEHPLRLEFWGDTVEDIRYLQVADQRSITPGETGEAADSRAASGLFAPPCRELLLTDTVGVGKTSVAAATARRCAASGARKRRPISDEELTSIPSRVWGPCRRRQSTSPRRRTIAIDPPAARPSRSSQSTRASQTPARWVARTVVWRSRMRGSRRERRRSVQSTALMLG